MDALEIMESAFGQCHRSIEPAPPESVCVMQVIAVRFALGNGVTTPYRGVMRYYSMDGELLAEHDPLAGKAATP